MNYEPARPMPAMSASAVHGDDFMSRGTTDSVPVITQYLRIGVRFKWLILGTIAAAVVIGLLVTLLMTRLYTANATIEIAREDTTMTSIPGAQQDRGGSVDQEFYQTQYGLLESRSLAERVATTLKLADNRDFLARHDLTDDAGVFASDRPLPASREARAKRLREVGAVLLDNIEVSPDRASRLVVLSYTDADPALAAQIANTWAEGFIQSNLERRFDATAYARRFLETRLAEVRNRLDQSERALVGYAARERIVNVGTAGEDQDNEGSRSIDSENLVALNQALAQARADRIAAESRFNQSRRVAGGASDEAVSNTAIGNLRGTRAEAAANLARLRAQFGPEYPQVAALEAQVRQLDQSVAREEARVGSAARSEYNEALARETALNARVEGLKDDVIDLRRRSIQYNIYQRDADTNRTLYDGLLQRYKEIGISGGVGSNNVSVVDRADVPEAPSRPRPLVNLALALVLGAAIGSGLALALAQIDESISDPTLLRANLGLPMLGSVPSAPDVSPFDQLLDRKSEMTEAYLSIATSLRFSTNHGIPANLAVTSSRAGEGKSTTALAIALTLARQGRRTILIDTDMRSPSVHHWFEVSNGKGVSNLLAGEAVLDEAVQPTTVENLSMMSAGPNPPNAAELLSGDGLSSLIRDLGARFDHVVIDAPPVLGLADAPLIASKVDGTIFVVEAHSTRSRVVKAAVDRLAGANAHILGAILTKLAGKQAGYGYDYSYGYGLDRETDTRVTQA